MFFQGTTKNDRRLNLWLKETWGDRNKFYIEVNVNIYKDNEVIAGYNLMGWDIKNKNNNQKFLDKVVDTINQELNFDKMGDKELSDAIIAIIERLDV
jgi:hypothetical protein